MENGTTTKRRAPVKLSLPEIEAAKLLIQLSSGDSEQDRNSNNNSNSYSVNHENKVDSEYVLSSSSISAQPVATEMSDSEEDERLFPRRKKRYRYVNQELYRVTSPLPAIDKGKIIKRRRK
ncbi:hypothetical protein RYX36_035302 [Vicia faba]